MLVRIVKMHFEEDKINEFLSFFDKNKELIRNFEGCRFLELYQDLDQANVFFTYSYWDQESDLENYRNSSLFKGVWATTKKWFNAKPAAWSVHKIVSLP
ncbi:hypothetical protein SAMN04487906_1964 [Zhouia amylolytica]|uniref:ABM domain-containing protein n=1 Tax=Zhouia amylolytica TaxID=376730 RepID=A0A1I6TC13_9FLAO|nr:antibiotic biosynthesis monooxygenase family protein [Zhouia amylolytica]MCQ0112220.1 antibiotic biosynthesis monooxygenase [Zhouia amylolytica]SFS86725.1 hypothetical protein SAMN04487906_1964 [Zhouia amylolytica]